MAWLLQAGFEKVVLLHAKKPLCDKGPARRFLHLTQLSTVQLSTVQLSTVATLSLCHRFDTITPRFVYSCHRFLNRSGQGTNLWGIVAAVGWQPLTAKPTPPLATSPTRSHKPPSYKPSRTNRFVSPPHLLSPIISPICANYYLFQRAIAGRHGSGGRPDTPTPPPPRAPRTPRVPPAHGTMSEPRSAVWRPVGPSPPPWPIAGPLRGGHVQTTWGPVGDDKLACHATS